jgi:hypothetical protein
MQRLQHGELDLAPEFQRRAGIWDDQRQSRLIESLLIRIPLPAFYLDELPISSDQLTEKFAVVDGVQRLSVLKRFINDGTLRLIGLEFLKKLEGKKYIELESPLQRRIQETQLAVNIVEPGTPDEAKLNIFKRINTGGVALTAQEIRHAMSPGPVRQWLKEVAEISEFKDAVGSNVVAHMAKRMEDRECVIRFAAFIDGGVQRYRVGNTDFDAFLLRAMARLNKLSEKERDAIRHRFIRAMRAARDCMGPYAFRKIGTDSRRGRLNKALFEATMVNFDLRTDAEIKIISNFQQKLFEIYLLTLDDNQINSSVSVGTGDPIRVERRFAAMDSVLKQVLQ